TEQHQPKPAAAIARALQRHVPDPRERAARAPFLTPARRKTKNAERDQARSSAREWWLSPEKRPAQWRANRVDDFLDRAAEQQNLCCPRSVLCLQRHEKASRQDHRCQCGNLPVRCLIAPARHNMACPKSRLF